MKMSKYPKQDKDHLRHVAEIPCLCCWIDGNKNVPAQVHHVLINFVKYDWATIPLCHMHHQGKRGIHTDKHKWRFKYGHENDMLEKLYETYGHNFNESARGAFEQWLSERNELDKARKFIQPDGFHRSNPYVPRKDFLS